MSARVFVHPRCAGGTANGALVACLEAAGYDMTKTVVLYDRQKPPMKPRFELVRALGEQNYERMDGTRFQFTPGGSPKEAA